MSMRLQPGMTVPVRRLKTLAGEVDLCSRDLPTHIQFRRFAGCPVCSLHLRTFIDRAFEVNQAMHELLVFHSSASELAEHVGNTPFAIVADPSKTLYSAFAVETGQRALSNPRAWLPIGRAVFSVLGEVLRGQKSMPPFDPPGGRLGLPADFMVHPDGMIGTCRYGEHIDDNWSVEEALFHAKQSASKGLIEG